MADAIPEADDQAALPPKPRGRRTRWTGAVVLALAALTFMLLARIYLLDQPPEFDEDLRPAAALDQTPMTRAPEKLRAFLDAIRPLEDLSLQPQPAWSWDTPSLARHLRTNGTALDNLRDLLEDADWHPRHAAWHGVNLSPHPAWPEAVRLLQAQAAYLARRAEEAEAFTAAIDLAELSRRLQDIWAWPGYTELGLQLQRGAVETLAELLKATRLPEDRLARFQDEFGRCQPEPALLREAFAAFYRHEKKLLLGPASGERLDTMPAGQRHQRPRRLFFKPNATLARFAAAFRELRDAAERPPYAGTIGSRVRRLSPPFYAPNAAGEAYFNARIAGYLDLPQQQHLARARHDLVRCLFALRRHVAREQRLPAALAELAPRYLAEVPADPFSGEPLRYEPARGRLYSVGLDLVPEGGKPTQPPLGDALEPTVELGIRVAAPVR